MAGCKGVLTNKNLTIIKENNYARIYDKNQLVACGVRKSNNLYRMLFTTVIIEANVLPSVSFRTLHERLGHVNQKCLRQMLKDDLVTGVNVDNSEDFFCESCVFGKQHKQPFKNVDEHEKRKARELIYSDVCGPFKTESVSGAKYFVISDKTPFEAWTGRKPDLEHIRVFGSVAYTHVPDQRRSKLDVKSRKLILVGYDGESNNVPDQRRRRRSKLDVKSRKLILVGYDGESNNYRLFDPVSKKITISRNVIFVEDVESDKDPNRSYMSFEFENANVNGNEDIASERSGDKEEEEYLEEIELEQVPNLRPRQNIKPPKRYELNLVETDIPQTYEEAMKSSDSISWHKAIDEELSALDRNDTWEMVPTPDDKNIIGCKWVFKVKKKPSGDVERNIIGCKWVFKVKKKPSGDVERYKARQCAKGFNQIKAEDHQETYAPTARFDTVRMALANPAKEKHHIIQFDDHQICFLISKWCSNMVQSSSKLCGPVNNGGRIYCSIGSNKRSSLAQAPVK
ncbi:GAG-pre-integrase domain [Popillia japonica]|uniref:GAG-pre-integrase domain n=1 Tax=Popillia japonica TaxID=7064 RepID=A0AAW1HSX9_POPJA